MLPSSAAWVVRTCSECSKDLSLHEQRILIAGQTPSFRSDAWFSVAALNSPWKVPHSITYFHCCMTREYFVVSSYQSLEQYRSFSLSLSKVSLHENWILFAAKSAVDLTLEALLAAWKLRSHYRAVDSVDNPLTVATSRHSVVSSSNRSLTDTIEPSHFTPYHQECSQWLTISHLVMIFDNRSSAGELSIRIILLVLSQPCRSTIFHLS